MHAVRMVILSDRLLASIILLRGFVVRRASHGKSPWTAAFGTAIRYAVATDGTTSSSIRETDQRSMADQITCPSCHFEFEISEVLASQLRDELRREYDAERRQLEHEFAGRQEDLRERTLALEAAQAALEQQIAERLAAERGRLEKDAAERAR